MKSIKQHTKLSELVADLRNKIGPICAHFELMNVLDEYPDDEQINKLFDNNEKLARKKIKVVIDLLHQFENFDLNR